MKFVIIGGAGGHFGEALIGAQQDPSLELAAIAPADGESVERLGDACRAAGFAPKVYPDWQSMLDAEKPDIAVLCPVYDQAASLSCEMLRRGISVYCEKPCATTLEDLEMLERTAAQSKAVYRAMLNYYYKPHYNRVHELVEAGEIGEIRLIFAQKSYKFGNARPDFYRSRARYGGTIGWVGIHALTWIHWFTGLKFKSVFAHSSTAANKGYDELDVVDTMSYELENGVLANVNVDFLNPAAFPTHGDDRIRLVGTDGVIEIWMDEIYLYNSRHSGKFPYQQDGGNTFRALADNIRTGAPMRMTAQDCFDITRAALLARRSADMGQLVCFTEDK